MTVTICSVFCMAASLQSLLYVLFSTVLSTSFLNWALMGQGVIYGPVLSCTAPVLAKTDSARACKILPVLKPDRQPVVLVEYRAMWCRDRRGRKGGQESRTHSTSFPPYMGLLGLSCISNFAGVEPSIFTVRNITDDVKRAVMMKNCELRIVSAQLFAHTPLLVLRRNL